ncbi:MAG: 3-isopropylmalate dehydrogenase [Clostridiales bacterium]|jgi:3-isopropylmalate dehydrogenase|nr:3-isopropylmalate dehydrogenase [Clostridiales bacterium]
MKAKIAVIRGDGIGPEITDAALTALGAIATKFSHEFVYSFPLLGGEAVDNTGVPLPQETVDVCKKSDAVLLGAVGGPKWDSLAGHLRPEKGLLGIRSALGLYANVRPAFLYGALKNSSPLRPDIVKNGIDLVVVRELTGGIYFGERGQKRTEKGLTAYDTEIYSVHEIERIAKIAFEIAQKRRKKVTSVDKANVLESGRLWRGTVNHVAAAYPDVKLDHMLVDNCAMQIIRDPSQFDVMLCPNMFGDILSDEAAMAAGSIGMLPSSSLGTGTLGLYEPIHGSAPDIAGTDTANPIATVLAAGMMLSTSLGLYRETEILQLAVENVLDAGYRTADIYTPSTKKVSCSKMAELIALQILQL